MLEENIVAQEKADSGSEKKEKKSGAFEGRMGRESYAKKMILYTIALMIAFLVIWVLILQEKINSSPMIIIGSIISYVVLSPLYIKRLHDIGHSGAYYLVSSLLYIPTLWGMIMGLKSPILMSLLSIPSGLFALYVIFWPGENKENRYGGPQRIRKEIFTTQKEQFRKEFLSFRGRLNRKWFFGVVFFAYFFLQTYSGMLDNVGLLFVLQGKDGSFIDISAMLIALVVGTAGTIVGLYFICSLIVRRLQDMGWHRILMILPLGIYLFSMLYPIYIMLTASSILDLMKALGWTALGFTLASRGDTPPIVYVFLIQLAIGLILIFWPSQKGTNKYGVNPVEAGLLPGEDGSAIELEIEVQSKEDINRE